MDARQRLNEIIVFDQKGYIAEQALLEESHEDIKQALISGIEDHREHPIALRRVADLCAQLDEGQGIELLLEIADSDNWQVRVHAMECLSDVAYTHYAVLYRELGNLLTAGDLTRPCLRDISSLVAEIDEPGAFELISPLLDSPDTQVVAGAIEGLSLLGDERVIDVLSPLLDDDRQVSFEDDESIVMSIGELAMSAHESFRVE